MLDDLGAGNFGKVYKAEDLKTKEVFAVKVYSIAAIEENPELNVPIMKECVQNEIKTMRIISRVPDEKTKNLLRLYEVHEVNNHIFLVMDLVSGGELLDCICKNVRSKDEFFTDQEVIHILKQ